jgi:hypothetical protein
VNPVHISVKSFVVFSSLVASAIFVGI